jgi:hypothetical protein
MAGHTRATLDNFDLGQFRAMVLNNDPALKKIEPVDMTSDSHLTRYSFAQATRFTTQYGDSRVNPDWLKVFRMPQLRDSLKDSPINLLLLDIVRDRLEDR